MNGDPWPLGQTWLPPGDRLHGDGLRFAGRWLILLGGDPWGSGMGSREPGPKPLRRSAGVVPRPADERGPGPAVTILTHAVVAVSGGEHARSWGAG